MDYERPELRKVEKCTAHLCLVTLAHPVILGNYGVAVQRLALYALVTSAEGLRDFLGRHYSFILSQK